MGRDVGEGGPRETRPHLIYSWLSRGLRPG